MPETGAQRKARMSPVALCARQTFPALLQSPAMPDEFAYDVFLTYSAKDKAVVRAVAEQLKKDKVKVWFDEWVLKPGDSIPAKIEEGLERSRVLVLCMSANAFGSDWTQLESGTFRFRDPLNKERRLVPLRLDDAPIKGSLAQFVYINWQPVEREQAYAKLLEACSPRVSEEAIELENTHSHNTTDKPIVIFPRKQEAYYFDKQQDGTFSIGEKGLITGRNISINWTIPRGIRTIFIEKISGVPVITAEPVALPHPPYRPYPDLAEAIPNGKWHDKRDLPNVNENDLWWVLQIRFANCEAVVKVEASA